MWRGDTWREFAAFSAFAPSGPVRYFRQYIGTYVISIVDVHVVHAGGATSTWTNRPLRAAGWARQIRAPGHGCTILTCVPGETIDGCSVVSQVVAQDRQSPPAGGTLLLFAPKACKAPIRPPPLSRRECHLRPTSLLVPSPFPRGGPSQRFSLVSGRYLYSAPTSTGKGTVRLSPT